MDSVQSSVANVLGLKSSSCIDIQVKQIGGGFGGKTTRPNYPAAAAALASFHLNAPVKLSMSMNDCMVKTTFNLRNFLKLKFDIFKIMFLIRI